MKLKLAILGVLAAAASPALFAASLDCAALANSALAEPAGYAAACGFTPPQTQSPATVNAPTDTAFVFNIRTGQPTTGFNSHLLNNMPGMTNLGAPGLTVFAMDFNPTATTLYILDTTVALPAAPLLRTVNLANGTATTVATVTGLSTVNAPSGLTINPTTGAAFVSDPTDLYSLNLTTGVATLIGPFNSGGLMIDISTNCAGQMYGHDIGTDSLYSINTTTGNSTLIGPHGLAANFAQGMDFDNNTNQLYAWVYTGGGTYTYGTFNLTTGAIVPLNTNTPVGEWEGATRTTCAPVQADLAITQSNSLPAGTPNLGAAFTKSITVTNNGPAASTAITVSDTLPAQLSFTGSNCGATAAGQVVTYSIPSLANAASNTCILNVSIAAPGTIVNTASITASTPADPTPGNNTTTAQIGPTGGALPPPPAPILPVPALDWLALAALLAALGGLGLFTMARRHG